MGSETKRKYVVVNGKHHRPAGEDAHGNQLTRTYTKGDVMELTEAEAKALGLFDGKVGNVRAA